MSKMYRNDFLCWLTRLWVAALVCLGTAQAAGPESNSATSLRTKYAELSHSLNNNQFKRPLVLDSVESPSSLKGDIYALIDYPFASVNEALNDPAHWCDVLILHLNTKYCRARTDPSGTMLTVSIGKKYFQGLDDAYRVAFTYRVATSTPDYFDIGLNAKSGPLGTSDYRIRLEAVALNGGKTFLHLTYSYAYNFVARVAMQGYLTTLGSGKVGFTRTGPPSGRQADYIGGVRGVVERNTMRYFLAIDAYLGALATPPAQQFEHRLQRWFASTDLYPRQLHEVSREAYLEMKRGEYLRMQKPP